MCYNKVVSPILGTEVPLSIGCQAPLAIVRKGRARLVGGPIGRGKMTYEYLGDDDVLVIPLSMSMGEGEEPEGSQPPPPSHPRTIGQRFYGVCKFNGDYRRKCRVLRAVQA
ncbi:hypothetical protein R1flu_022539 [Riccia fluitans]|uniref:Ribosomal protein L2 n=1 Tax=Riccia fluitans TaxID=41844 RepID=A0ABD1XPG9_9MARC